MHAIPHCIKTTANPVIGVTPVVMHWTHGRSLCLDEMVAGQEEPSWFTSICGSVCVHQYNVASKMQPRRAKMRKQTCT